MSRAGATGDITNNTQESPSHHPVDQEQTEGGVVKWLYPKEFEGEVMADATENMKSEDDKKDAISVGQNSLTDQGSIDSCETKEELEDDEIDVSEITEEITKQVTAGTKALGSMFNMAWGKTQKVADSGMKASTSLFNFAAGYDLNKPSDDEDEDTSYQKKDSEADKGDGGAIPKSQSSFFGTAAGGLTSGFSGFSASSAWSKVSDMTTSAVTKSTSWTSDLAAAATAKSDDDKKDHEAIDEEAKEEEGQGGLFGGLSAGIGADLSSLVKVASDATTAIKAKSQTIINATILNEFNKEQEDFIKNKGETTTTDIEEKKGD